jgi:CID domain
MSSWGKKLDKKLATLTDNASKETIQTVANWIVFNRKHASTIASTLTQNLQEQAKIENTRRLWLYWQLIHEILVAERETPAKWEKSIDLRVALGEALIPAMELLGSSMASSSNTTEMSDYLKEWESLNVFGGPSLMSQIKRLYANRNSISAADEAPQQQTASTLASVKQEELESASAPVAEAPGESAESTASQTKTTDTVKTKLEETPAKRRSSFSQNNKIVDYDFDAKVR